MMARACLIRSGDGIAASLRPAVARNWYRLLHKKLGSMDCREALEQIARIITQQKALETHQRQRGIWDGELGRIDAYRRITEIVGETLKREDLRPVF
jgi:hypothetical protein